MAHLVTTCPVHPPQILWTTNPPSCNDTMGPPNPRKVRPWFTAERCRHHTFNNNILAGTICLQNQGPDWRSSSVNWFEKVMGPGRARWERINIHLWRLQGASAATGDHHDESETKHTHIYIFDAAFMTENKIIFTFSIILYDSKRVLSKLRPGDAYTVKPLI